MTTTNGNKITATAGTVTVWTSGNNFTIGALDNGDVFTVNGTEYTMTNIGLKNGNSLKSVGTSVPIAALATGWDTILTTDGALTISTADITSDKMIVANTASATASVKYGELTRNGGVYTFSKNDGTGTLTSITVDGVTAVLDTNCAGTITFTVATENDDGRGDGE